MVSLFAGLKTSNYEIALKKSRLGCGGFRREAQAVTIERLPAHSCATLERGTGRIRQSASSAPYLEVVCAIMPLKLATDC